MPIWRRRRNARSVHMRWLREKAASSAVRSSQFQWTSYLAWQLLRCAERFTCVLCSPSQGIPSSQLPLRMARAALHIALQRQLQRVCLAPCALLLLRPARALRSSGCW